MIRLNTHKTKVLLLVCSSIFVFYCTSYSQTVSSNRFKRIDYEYDLVSGKVNKVSYQKDSADQFIHQYSYDSDNRITKVETSSDNVVWDVDAKYFYYAHGPLARTEIGNDKVQGIDYAYTLQGWIKGVNSNTLDKKRDMGQDGKDTSIYDPSNPQLHANFAQDAFGYSLNYFKGDYKAISQVRWNNATNRFEAVTTGSELMQQTHDLYNGNIKSMVTAITQIDTTSAGNVNPQIPKPLGNAYKYDQLNRIKKSVSFTNIDLIGNLWQSSGQTIANMYGNTFSYDANGNILTQNRSDEIGQEFEALNYKYRTVAGKLRQNRLYHVNDNINYTSLKTDDIDDQGHFAAGASSNPLVDSVGQFNNYSYDNIGNLVKDKAEQIANIEWTVYGKVKRILRTAGSAKDNLVFDYDPNGNRIAKHVYDNANNWKYTTYYLRDAQGNVMCTYEHKNIPPPGGIGSPSMSFVLQEQHIYGNSRLGMYIPNKQLINHSSFTIGFKSHVLGKKLFEMGNHLGNILSVISDKKIPIDNNSDGVIDEYQVDLLTSNDFSPFGVKLYKRGSSLGNYRYGFNGKENDNETVGTGEGTLDYGMRIYNPALGRFLSVDPLAHVFPFWSPYHFAGNSPIENLDLDGLEILNYKTPFRLSVGGAALNNYVAEYSWSDDKWEGVDMAETAALMRKGYSAMPMAMNIAPHAKNPGLNQGQVYFKLTPEEQQAADFFSVSYSPEMSDAESNTTSGAAGDRQKNQRYVRSNTNKTTEGRAGALGWLIQKIGEGIFGKSPVKASIDAKKDLNNMINAYRDAIDFVDNSWDFTGAADAWGWTEKQVQQFRVDVINFVADGKLPNNAAKDYLSAVENYGVKAIVDNKKQGADAQKKLESK